VMFEFGVVSQTEGVIATLVPSCNNARHMLSSCHGKSM